MSRVDTFLKNTGLFKARAQARRACDEGRVRVDGAPVRGSRTLRVGERLQIEEAGHRLEVEVLALPERPVARAARPRFVRQLQRQRLPGEILSFDDEP